MADFNFVTNRIATGAALTNADDVEQIYAAGINVVVDARAEFDDGPLFAGKPGIHYFWNPTKDDGTHKPTAYWQHTLGFVMPLLSSPHFKVLLHCSQGINRGPSNALCVMVAQGLDPVVAEMLIRRARPQVGLAYKENAIRACQWLGYM